MDFFLEHEFHVNNIKKSCSELAQSDSAYPLIGWYYLFLFFLLGILSHTTHANTRYG
jgi:hypothetical protein